MQKNDYSNGYCQYQTYCQQKEHQNALVFKNSNQIERDGMKNEEMKAVLQHQPFGASMYMPISLKSYREGIVTEDYFHCS